MKYGISAKTNDELSRKWQKKRQKHLIWTHNGQKVGDQIFFRVWRLNKMCRECSNLLKYEISAKTNEAFSRKGRKSAKNPYFGDKMLNNLDTHFFFKNRASSLYTLATSELPAKKLRNPMAGSMRTFVAD